MTWVPAPGKLNLCLHVLGRRDDGAHLLQTVLRLIERGDRVGIGPRADGEISFSGAFGEDNLCVRAARLLKQSARSPQGCDIKLEKKLPLGGGLGGGSSDAASTLLALNRLWGCKLGRARLMELGLRLGADVPFFVYGRSALGEGIGERLSQLELPAAWYLVLVPQVSVSTQEIFSDRALTRNGKPLKIPPFLSGRGRNDLEPVACDHHPDIAAHLAWLRKHRPDARMTGSGACVFAELGSESEARALQARLPGAMQGFVTRGLDRHPLCDWAD